MAKQKILTVIGTRPQFIKYSALSGNISKSFDEILVDTGQHYSKNLSEYFIDELSFKRPTYTLGVRHSDHLRQLPEMIRKLGIVANKEKPTLMICFGDTNSTLSAAIVSSKLRIPLVHIEAGERNFDINGNIVHPGSIPEETNRVITDALSSLLLCSSRRGISNLETEHVKGKIEFTGDIMYDLFLQNFKSISSDISLLNKLNLKPKSYYYCTVHRAINSDNKERLSSILEALSGLEKLTVFPVHPRTFKALKKFGLYERYKRMRNIVFMKPVGYKDSLSLSYNSAFVLTDSGGVVREAFFGGIPSVMLDDTSEWKDMFDSGWSVLAGADRSKILDAVSNHRRPKTKPALFGNGNAVNKTIQSIINWFN